MLLYTQDYTRLNRVTQGCKGYIGLHMVALVYTGLHRIIYCLHEGYMELCRATPRYTGNTRLYYMKLQT